MKKTIISVLFTLTALFLGFLVSGPVNGFLGIMFKDKPGVEAAVPALRSGDTVGVRPLNLRLADLGGVGILPDTANWGIGYEHNVHRFEDLILAEPPYLNPAAYQRIGSELNRYLNRLQQFSINGIVFPAFLELVTFDEKKGSDAVYSESDGYRQRHLALHEGYGKWIKEIRNKGIEVYLYTDMVALTPPLEDWLTRHYGTPDGEKDGFWDIYKVALEELFTRMPEVSGIMLRIGEAGSIYNKPGWDYYSQLDVRSETALNRMLTAFLEVAEKYNKQIIFRSWSVGIGEIGDMHTNPATYEKVLGNIHSPNLIVSTKYSRGDFYSWLPFNETLLQGSQRRIAEFQLRREFEGFNAFPNFMGPLYQKALLDFTRKNEHFDGVWLWTQEGGPLRAGPLSIYPLHGFNLMTDLNVYAMGQLVNNPKADIRKITSDWVGQNFGTDSVLNETVTEVMLNSHATVQKGLYIGPFAKYDVRALGLEPPPMLWIFEWDIVGGSPSVFSNIYQVSKDHLDEAIREGEEAVAEAGNMLERLRSVSSRAAGNPEPFSRLLSSVAYEQNLFATLADFRNYMLSYYKWLDQGGSSQKDIWQAARKEYVTSEQAHTQAYTGNLDFPAYNFREANVAATIAGRTDAMVWLARILGLIFLAAFIFGNPRVQRGLPDFRGRRTMAMLWFGVVNPSGSGETSCARADTAPLILFTFAYLTLALSTFTSFAAPVFVISLMACSVLYIGLNAPVKANLEVCDKTSKVISLLAPAVAFTGLLMLFAAWRGPMAFWHFFWTSAPFRVVFFMLFLLFVLRAYYTWAVTMRQALRLGKLYTAGVLVLFQGILFAAGGGLVDLLGFEKVLTIFNDELLMLPGGLSRILGITTHLEIPADIPHYVMIIGLIMGAAGGLGVVLLSLFTPREKRNNTSGLR